RTERKDLALGANLIGALAGGLLQSVTFLTGIRALLLVVAGLYLLALATLPLAPTPATRTASAPPPDPARPDAQPVASSAPRARRALGARRGARPAWRPRGAQPRRPAWRIRRSVAS